jgi:hypothetical protein
MLVWCAPARTGGSRVLKRLRNHTLDAALKKAPNHLLDKFRKKILL